MALRFDQTQAREMHALETEINLTLLRANAQHMEAAIAAFACIRSARTLLDKYPQETRRMLVEKVVAYLEHRDAASFLM